jgi:hypothetical protein
MRSFKSLKSQDVMILLKIISLKSNPWRTTDLAYQLFMSQSEISQSLNRSCYAGLLDDTKRKVHRESLFEFLLYGVKYVFPQKPGAIVRGIPTAHSAPPLSNIIRSDKDIYVWQDEDGTIRGEKIEPLYPSVPKAVKTDQYLYELLSLVDAIRVGRIRELKIASDELKKRIFSK